MWLVINTRSIESIILSYVKEKEYAVNKLFPVKMGLTKSFYGLVVIFRPFTFNEL